MKALVYEGPRKVTVNMALRPMGGVGVVVAEDPGSPDDLMKEGKLALDFGQLWLKGQRIATGQANVKAYNRKLRDVIAAGKAKRSAIISHELPLEQAAEGYEHFDARDCGWTKVVLKTAWIF